MKKYVTVSLISSLILAILGTLLIIIGVMCGGIRQARDEMYENFDDWTQELNIQVMGDFNGHDIVMEDVSFNPNQPIHIGKYSDLEAFSKDEVSSIEIYSAAGSFDIENSENDYYGVEGASEGGFQFYVEDDVLYLLAISTDSGDAITVYLPSGCTYDSIDVSLAAGEMDVTAKMSAEKIEVALGAGSITIAEIETESLKASVGAGSLMILDGSVGEASLDVAAGELTYRGIVTGDIEGAVAAGSMSLEIEGEENMFNYDLSTAMGGVSAGSRYTAGIGSNESYSNNANQSMQLSSAVGYIEVDFY